MAGLAEPLGATAALHTLELGSCGIGAGGSAALAAAAARGTGWARLGLGFNPDMGDEGVAALAVALQRLEGSGGGAPTTDAQQAGAAADNNGAAGPQAAAGGAAQLEGEGEGLLLDVSGVAVGPAALKALAALQDLHSLTMLGGRLEGGGAAVLAAALQQPGSFPRLADLNLAGCRMALEDLKHVLETAASPGVAPALATLVVAANPAVEEEGFEQLVERAREARPGLEVHWRGGADGADGADGGGAAQH